MSIPNELCELAAESHKKTVINSSVKRNVNLNNGRIRFAAIKMQFREKD